MNIQEPRTPKEIKVLDDYIGMYDYLQEDARQDVMIIHDLYANKKTKFVIQLLEALLKKYPHDPYIVATAGYTLYFCEKKERGYNLLQQNFAQNPDNLYAKCYFARVNLLMNHIDAAFAILDEKLLIEEMYPDKEEFYVAELAELFFTFGMFFSKIKIARGVYRSIKQLEQFLPQNHPYIRELYEALRADKVDIKLLAQEIEQMNTLTQKETFNAINATV